jgi:peptidoglycan/LPS O-acetylase OafA/YrhL
VLAFHAFPTSLRGGFVGVDVFFVISGYLISGIILHAANEGRFSFVDFYGRRIRRIFPALIIVLLCCLTYGWAMLLPHDYAEFGENTAGGAGFISNFVLLAQSDYFSAAADAKPLLHLWSLGIEEQYYFCWPLILWIGCRRNWNMVLVTVAVASVSFALNVAQVKANAAATFYLPQTRFWELLMGAALAAYYQHRAERESPGWAANARSAIGILCVGAGILTITETFPFPGWWALLPTLGTSLVISAGQFAWLNRRILSSRLLVWFGLISYPLYLWHWPLLSLASLHDGHFPSRGFRVVIVAASVALAWVTYRYVEKPIRFKANGGRKSIALLVSMAAVGLLGFAVYSNAGFPRRYPKLIQQIDALAHDNDHKAAWRERSCFLESDQGPSAFSTCDPSQLPSAKPILFLWGDSLAAQLYPGYESVYGEAYTVVQRTAASCAPIFGDEYNDSFANCNAVNAAVMKLIEREKPECVVLSGRWSMHEWAKVGGTIAKLREAGVKHIDLIGPVPRWSGTLPRQLILYIAASHVQSIPERMKFGLERGYADMEPSLRKLAEAYHVEYVSPVSILCNDGGCLTSTGGAADTITSFDYDHLSPAGSIFAVARFPQPSAMSQ